MSQPKKSKTQVALTILFGRKVKEARAQKGWKQLDLVRESGLTQKYVSEVELGHIEVRWSRAVHLAHVLGFSLDELAKRTTL